MWCLPRCLRPRLLALLESDIAPLFGTLDPTTVTPMLWLYEFRTKCSVTVARRKVKSRHIDW